MIFIWIRFSNSCPRFHWSAQNCAVPIGRKWFENLPEIVFNASRYLSCKAVSLFLNFSAAATYFDDTFTSASASFTYIRIFSQISVTWKNNKQNGYIDVGDECWRRNMLVTTIRCWWRFWPFWSPMSTIFLHYCRAPTFNWCHQHPKIVTNFLSH